MDEGCWYAGCDDVGVERLIMAGRQTPVAALLCTRHGDYVQRVMDAPEVLGRIVFVPATDRDGSRITVVPPTREGQ